MEPTWNCGRYSCAKEEQCDGCWLQDHYKECGGCRHYDHPEMKEGTRVTGNLVTGERAVGFYSTTSPTTGSILLKNVTTDSGNTAEFAWAENIDPKLDISLANYND